MTNTQKSVLGGMTVLGLSGIICKVVGVLYRIPLAMLIGDEGIGTYQLVFPTYNLLLTISSAGIPVAISRMVSFCLTKDDPRNAKRIFRIALYLLSILGLIGTLMMIVFSGGLSQSVGDPETRLGYIAIAPALLLVCTMSAFRGFMQGQQDMKPTAISQLIEQVGKVLVALPLAYVGAKYGMAQGQINVGMSAAGALLGTSLAEAVALGYMMLLYQRRLPQFRLRRQDEAIEPMKTGTLLRRLFSLAIPITLGACIVPLASFVDSQVLVNRLVDSAGYTTDVARAMYGRYSGYVITLINVPTAIAIAIAMSLVPAISASIAKQDQKGVRHSSQLGLRFSFLVGLPCSFGMSILSKPLLSMIYRFSSEQALNLTADLLSISSMTIVLFTVVQSTSGILQGLRKQRIPMYTLAAGVAIKIVLNYTLVGIPGIHIYGAPIASICCYTISMIPNLHYVFKYADMRFAWGGSLFKPLLATLMMSAVVVLLKAVLPQRAVFTVLLVLIGIVSYFGFALVTGALTKDDLNTLRKRRR